MVYKTLGLCRSCYDRRRSLGDENKPRVYTRGFTVAEKMSHYRTDDGPGECFGWLGRISQQGYAQLWTEGRKGSFRAAHRVAYELEHGEIPEGFQIDHTCHNANMTCPGGSTCLHRRCTNPAHLAAKTRRENMADARRGERGNWGEKHNGSKTEDKWGHKFTPENTAWYGNARQCLECRRLRSRGEHPTQIARRVSS